MVYKRWWQAIAKDSYYGSTSNLTVISDWIGFLFRLGKPLAWRLFFQVPSEHLHTHVHIHNQSLISQGSLLIVGVSLSFSSLPPWRWAFAISLQLLCTHHYCFQATSSPAHTHTQWWWLFSVLWTSFQTQLDINIFKNPRGLLHGQCDIMYVFLSPMHFVLAEEMIGCTRTFHGQTLMMRYAVLCPISESNLVAQSRM